jgi:hypothetical protein
LTSIECFSFFILKIFLHLNFSFFSVKKEFFEKKIMLNQKDFFLFHFLPPTWQPKFFNTHTHIFIPHAFISVYYDFKRELKKERNFGVSICSAKSNKLKLNQHWVQELLK